MRLKNPNVKFYAYCTEVYMFFMDCGVRARVITTQKALITQGSYAVKLL